MAPVHTNAQDQAHQGLTTPFERFPDAAIDFDYFGPKDTYGEHLSSAIPDPSTQDIHADVLALRDAFNAGVTKDLAARRKVLLQLQCMLRENESVLQQALWKDLHRHPTESVLFELTQTHLEIQDNLNHLEAWSKPQSVATNLANAPGSSQILREPLGVVCIVGTWNYPINVQFMPLASAIAAGNCVLLRLPGDDTTRHLNNVLIHLISSYIDPRFVRIVFGGVDETKKMLTERFDLIFATGGAFLGKIVARAAAETLTPIVLEMGGKSPVIIDETADLALAARRIAWSAFANSGQICVRPDYLLVDARVGDKFVRALQQQLEQFFGQDPQRADCFGRLINHRAFDRVFSMLDADRTYVAHGGAYDREDRFIAPTLLNFGEDLAAFQASATMQQEVFGPVLPIAYYPPGDLATCVRFITAREKPLALYLFSSNSTNKHRITRETTAGSMAINECMMQTANPNLPFGGVGASGMGVYHGRFGFETFSHRKSLLSKSSTFAFDLPARYPPYTPRAESIFRIGTYPFTKLQQQIMKGIGAVLAVGAIALVVVAVVL